MNRIIFYIKLYYPVVLSFLSFLYSVSLWFSGYQLEGVFVGIWVPSILAFAICIRQRRNDYYRAKAAQDYYQSRSVKFKRRKK